MRTEDILGPCMVQREPDVKANQEAAALVAVAPVSVLAIHNHYQQPGGEDQVFADETALLERKGHEVVRYEEYNSRINRRSIGVGINTVWSTGSFHRLRNAMHSTRFDIAHFHNTFPLVSPAGYYAARRSGLSVVQTLQNFRLICPGATLLRNGTVCEDCIHHGSFAPAIRHGCYRESRSTTAVVAGMLAVHSAAGTWRQLVNVYIASSEFMREKFINGGLPAEKIATKPNFLGYDPGPGKGDGGYALFIGRLSEEKGVRFLARAWQKLSAIPLIVAGKGPLDTLEWPENVTIVGHQSREQVFSLMCGARILIFPSIWYECSPMTIIEALACGLPVVASNLGSIPEHVTHRKTGLLFQPNNVEELTQNVLWAWEHPEELRAMRAAARCEYEQKYTAERNYKRLMEIYDRAIENTRTRRAIA